MTRRVTWMAAAAAGLVLTVSGCGGAPPAPGGGNSGGSQKTGANANGLDWNKTSDPSLKGQTITVLWTDTNGPNGPKAKLLKQFTKETGIKVRELGVAYNNLYDKVMTAAMANTSDIDVVEMDTIWAGQYYQGHIAVDLTHVIPKQVQDGFTPSSLGSVTYQGHLMAMPWYSSTKHFYWNNKLLHEADITHPPRTWDEFRQDSLIIQKKLGPKGIYASGWSWKQAESLTCDYVGMVGAFGGQFFDKNGHPAFDKGGGLKALQFMVQLMKDKTVDPASLQWTEQDVLNAFEAGKIAMMSNWEGVFPQVNDPSQSKIVGQADVGLLPGEGNVVSASCTGSEGVAIMQNSKHKEAALAFLKWIGSREYQLAEFQQEGQYPSLKSLYNDPALKKADTSHTLAKIQAQFQYGINRPNAPGYVNWSDTLASALHSALSGQMAPDKALQKAAAKIEQAIQNENS
ncbi:ABC transporter substrate-binding protein [Alicyclobacillus cellulosilyticus]|uniref:ABC transporter substrate-binding protein n=1 Tax=Alicyclobacillus cellulosilyticus TaxID=1003997 RepID=A0A917K7B0_9BACL|nr:extracellular solute-binding protein [Alicyclobacillus cellulosilyticus]GGJ02646.1 ABC transporter substrate-binding protein [Alicyclobacillus cellulosilyticus]